MDKLLVIDDEPAIRRTLVDVLQSGTLRILGADNSTEGLRLMREESPAVVLLDIRLGRESGLEVFRQIREVDPKVLVVFITGHGTADTAIEAMKLGAFDYLVKPLDVDQLQQVIDQALKISRLMRTPALVETEDSRDEDSDRLIGSGSAMQAICKQIGRIAPQEINVLIFGESGTGKELVARAIYQHSRRNQAPFLAINCAAIPESLLESELFGHEKGAFTDADRRRIGKFEQCHNGTLFLDEVGDMPAATQAKILRLLQDGQFQRVGGSETVTVNVRILAATNHNLDAMIDDGRFRRDLFYRLRGVTLVLPPLRDRRDDIPELAHYFLFRFNRQLGTAVQSISPEALEKLQNHNWHGNVRELQSVIREALIASTGPTLLPEFLPLEIQSDPLPEVEAPTELTIVGQEDWRELGRFVEQSLAQSRPDVYQQALARFDRLVVNQAMKVADGFQSRASQLLNLSRPTLRSKLRTIFADPLDQSPPST
ncbi:MAG: sigma-54-dependent transcriptional regulator [Planctomycetales bacterium]